LGVRVEMNLTNDWTLEILSAFTFNFVLVQNQDCALERSI